jgi:O-acetylhomoserine (thiol)-lyase
VAALRDKGAALASQSAFLLLMGLETLGLRMERDCENALKAAEYLETHPKVAWVNYAGSPENRYNALASSYSALRIAAITSDA